MKEEKRTLLEMIVGIALYTVFIGLIGAMIVRPWYTFLLGTILGGIVAVLVLLQMYDSLNKALEMPEEHAIKYGGKNALLRILIMGLALVIGILLPGIFNILGILFGTLGLKLSAYLQPVIHKILASKI